ncbi:respiratory nitrate reductase subunit gamma [Desulfosoma sp.]|uniref:respiratory nitrate reductase subunit gamma n=1 Tax=Desulfosoma sp. TaxID=2603217 RepID=UPI00404927C3
MLGVEAYRAYLWSLVTLKPFVPDEIVYSGHGFMLVLHVFFANVFLMVFPFTKMMHTFLALPMNLLKRG